MNLDARGLSASPVPASGTTYRVRPVPRSTDGEPDLQQRPSLPQHASPQQAVPQQGGPQQSGPRQSGPQQSVPGTAAALPVAETALRRVLAAQAPTGAVTNPTATALDLLRSVEALLRASAPEGTSPEEIGAAAARLVERQGLLARLAESTPGPQPTNDLWSGTASDGIEPSSVDTRL